MRYARSAFVAMYLSWPLVAAAGADAHAMPVRSFDRFEFDTATAPGLWAEVATAMTRDEPQGASIDVVTVEPRLIYGGEWAEGGLFIPYERLSGDAQNPFFGTQTFDADGIGDIRLYGKVVPLRTPWAAAGLGLEVSFPTGDDSTGLGTGEGGFLPYGMAAVHLGPADVRAHFGYQTYTSSNKSFTGFSVVERAPDSFVYGGGLFAALTDCIGVRAELIAQTFDTADNNAHVLFFEPGVDLRIPFGAVDFVIRPTGAVGLTHDAPDWGVGGSVGVVWNPNPTR
jgi:outer membrane putative beta-barrel porin/alpha-amylase